ncbi:MAG: hypothetical protein JSW50_06040, partial [Candidatus Latescibacterota bacterium]
YQLAIIIAAFMSGMAGGAFLALRRTARNPAHTHRAGAIKMLLALQCAAGVFPVLMVWLFMSFRDVADPVSSFVVTWLLFPLLAALAGQLGGYQFVVASDVYFAASGTATPLEKPPANPGILYALDLAGACLGAIALSTFLIPVFGFEKTALVIAVVNAAPILLIISALQMARRSHSIP